MRALYQGMTPTRRSAVATVALIALLVPLGYVFIFGFAPSRVSVSGTEQDPAAREKIRHDARTAAIQFLGVIGLAIGAAFTARTVVISRQGQITDRFGRAIEQLGNEALDVRTGAIYALERIARESREDHGPTMEVLTAFVRGRSAAKQKLEPGQRPRVTRTNDVQAALTVIGRRSLAHDGAARFDLRTAYLRNADLSKARLDDRHIGYRFSFDGAHLEGAVLNDAHVEGASFEAAHLEGASMRGCTGDAHLTSCQGQGAFIARSGAPGLYEAKLEGARLAFMTLSESVAGSVQLQGALLLDLVMSGLDLYRADLAGATLNQVDLRGASLKAASLRGAQLTRVNLDRADLTDVDLSGIQFDDTTTWPDGFDPVAHGAHAPHPAAAAFTAKSRAVDARGLRLDNRTLDLSDVDLSGVDLRGAALSVASLGDLGGAILRGAEIAADLSGAQLARVDARGAKFGNATLTGASVEGADLRGADLTRATFDVADIQKANLAGAQYNSRTVWPAGFDPVAAGAVQR